MTNIQMRGETTILRGYLDQAIGGGMPMLVISVPLTGMVAGSETMLTFTVTEKGEDHQRGGGHLEGTVALGDEVKKSYRITYTREAYQAKGRHVVVKYDIVD